MVVKRLRKTCNEMWSQTFTQGWSFPLI